MSYMRGEHYVWSDGDRLHVWVADGYDGWDDSVWLVGGGKPGEGRSQASGVGISETVMDEFIMMRLAQMIQEDLVEDAMDRAVIRGGSNFGCAALAKNIEVLKVALRKIQLKDSE